MSWNVQPPTIYEWEDELQLKLKFAAIVARNPNEKLSAGYRLFEGEANYGRAMQAQAWLHDPVVREEISRLTETSDASSMLPSKEALTHEILMRAKGADDRDAEKFYKLAADMMGHLPKGGTNIDLSDRRVVNVLRVPNRDVTAEDDADFDQKFYIQQNALIADAKSNRPAETR